MRDPKSNITLVTSAILLGAAPPFFAADNLNRTWDAAGEFAVAGDVNLIQTTALGDLPIGGWDNSLSIAVNAIDLDYEPVPFDFRGYSTKRRELNTALQLNGERLLDEEWTLLAAAGGYLGYTNYRSAWLDEYFYQQFWDFPKLPNSDVYTSARPRGVNAMIGTRWAYHPASGYVQITASQLRDHVSPGYEVDFDGLTRGPDVLNTTALNLDFENVLTPRTRSMLRFRASKTSHREWRLGAEAWFNIAAGDEWIVRLNVGYTEEDPEFEATFAGLTVEREISERMSLIANGRYYSDTGEIENALLFTSSAPAMDSWQAQIGLRWLSDGWSSKFTIGILNSSYAETNPNTDFFQNLYADRTWLVGQFAMRRSF